MSVIIIFLQKAIAQGMGMLYGALGEIVTEKSGNLNLGVPGVMYMGGIAGLMGAFFYENGNPAPDLWDLSFPSSARFLRASSAD